MVASFSPSVSVASCTRFGSNPASASTWRAYLTVIASGSTARGCGLTTTGLPVASEANRPGYEFQVGNVLQPMTSATPRGTTWNVFVIRSGSPLPAAFSHPAVPGWRVISAYAYATASRARSSACAPPAWNAITNAWPLVNCTALASSNTLLCSRSRISRQTPARACGPASRQAGSAALAADTSWSAPACG